MSSRWANPINNNILRDLEGTVLAGGDLEFYEAGTSTPLAVYSDSALSVSLGSTLTADAFGLIADFHMAAGTQYKMVAKDSGGTTKWTRDDVFSLDTSVDTRLDSLETSVAAISSGKNAIRNSSCQKQRVDSNGLTVTAPSISSTFQLGTVAGHYVKSTNVTAGTITRGTSTGLTSGYYIHASGVSNDNSAATVVAQFRVDPGDAGQFVNTSGVFSCQVYHDVGSAVDYTVTVKKADAEDDYSSLTTISTSGATSVNSGAWTGLEFSVSAMGDCRNGVVIEVSAACGVQTTKNYYFGMPQFETGTTATAWTSTPAENDLAGLEYKPRQYAAEFINSTCRISQDTDTDHDILVPSGSGARDSTDAFDIITSADITKQIDNAASPPASTGWVEGDDQNGFPSGVNSGVPAASTWYYFFLIAKTDGTVDAGFDSSATAANLLADATGYTYYRHIGSVRTDASANIASVVTAFDDETIIVDEKSNGTAGGGFTNGAWRTRDLNAVYSDGIHGVSVSSNQISVPAGDYIIKASAPASNVGSHKVKIRNVTDGADLLIGTSESAPTGCLNRSFVEGRVSLSASKTIELQHQCQTTVAATGLGIASSFSVVEVYGIVSIRKIA